MKKSVKAGYYYEASPKIGDIVGSLECTGFTATHCETGVSQCDVVKAVCFVVNIYNKTHLNYL